MKDKLLYSAVGGCIGAILTLTLSLFSPINAQNEPPDATFGKITCTELEVTYAPTATIPSLRVRIVGEERGGSIEIKGRTKANRINLDGWDHEGAIRIEGDSSVGDVTEIRPSYIILSIADERFPNILMSSVLEGIFIYDESYTKPLVKLGVEENDNKGLDPILYFFAVVMGP